MKTLIGLIGLRRAGKDTAAQALVNQGFENVKFADALKGMLRTYLAYRGVSPCLVEEMIEGKMKEEAVAAFGGKSTRFAMQTLGTEWGRDTIASDLWVDTAMARARQFDRVVVSDVRFPNEVEAIKQAGGKIIRIWRPGLTVDSHPSESLIESLFWHVTVANDGTIEDLHNRIQWLLPHLPSYV